MLSDEQLLEQVKGALLAVNTAIERKGEDVRRKVNAKADFSSVGDSTANDALVQYFRDSGLPATMYTEELDGALQLSKKPEYGVIADDIDGTKNQSSGFGMLPNGPIVGIADNSDPTFNEVRVAGFMELNSGNLFYAVKGTGSYLIEGFAHGKSIPKKIGSSGLKTLSGKANVILDIYMLGNLNIAFDDFILQNGGDFRCKAAHFSLIAAGSADIFIVGDNAPNIKKLSMGEEIGPFYLILKEAGCSVVDWNGKDIGAEKIGLGDKKTFNYITAATKELAAEFVGWMQKNSKIKDYMKKKGL